jgi:type IV secretory pathway TraG/TraD family ATPase VirD4
MKGFLDQLLCSASAERPQRVRIENDELNRPLLQFGASDCWTVRDACEGTAIFGATGSGKTSGSGAAIARSFLSAGFGGLVLCAKPDEPELWRKYCRETNRSDSLIIFSPKNHWRFNFLNYELSRPGVGAGHTENLVRLFSTVMQVAERARRPDGGQDFWERTTKQLLRNCFDLIAIARGRLLLEELYSVLISAPQNPEEVQSVAWQESSLCFRCIQEGEAKCKSTQQANDFTLAVKYWLKEFPALSGRTRSIIVTNLTSMLDIFLRGTLRELFCTTTNLVPELTHAGAVLVVSLPLKEFNEIGQTAQALMKFIWQRAAERRSLEQRNRVTFLWADEAQFFVDSNDAQFQSTARSSRMATVYLSQNIGAYYREIGEADTHSLMGNLGTKLFHANGDPMTNNWAADLFSKSWQYRGSAGTSLNDGVVGNQTVSRNYGSTDSLDYEVLPQEFTCLRKGGPENERRVEAVAFQGGRIWHATNKNHCKVDFLQH